MWFLNGLCSLTTQSKVRLSKVELEVLGEQWQHKEEHLGMIQRQECGHQRAHKGGMAWRWDIFGHQMNEEKGRKNTEVNVTM